MSYSRLSLCSATPALTAHGECLPGAGAPTRLLSGTLYATAAMVRIDPGIIGGWLPAGIRLPETRPDPHPLIIIWGSQQEVSAFPGGSRFPIPWKLSYSEIITAVPDLRLDSKVADGYDGPVTYLPRLYMNSWRAALLGRALYGFCKAYARIDGDGNKFRAADRRGRPLMTASVEGRSAPRTMGENCHGLFRQPVALSASGRLILARFETTMREEILHPVSVQIDIRPALLSWLPAIHRFVPGVDQELNGAFRFSTAWALMRMG